MKKKGKHYTKEQIAHLVEIAAKLVTEEGITVSQAAHRLYLAHATLHRWLGRSKYSHLIKRRRSVKGKVRMPNMTIFVSQEAKDNIDRALDEQQVYLSTLVAEAVEEVWETYHTPKQDKATAIHKLKEVIELLEE